MLLLDYHVQDYQTQFRENKQFTGGSTRRTPGGILAPRALSRLYPPGARHWPPPQGVFGYGLQLPSQETAYLCHGMETINKQGETPSEARRKYWEGPYFHRFLGLSLDNIMRSRQNNLATCYSSNMHAIFFRNSASRGIARLEVESSPGRTRSSYS